MGILLSGGLIRGGVAVDAIKGCFYSRYDLLLKLLFD